MLGSQFLLRIIDGEVLLFSPELLHGTDLGRRIDDYHFFSYYESESLHPTPEEQRTIEVCFKMIRNELRSKPDNEHLRRPNYFGDLIRQATGETATAIIRNFVMQRATAYLHDGKTISETSELLGFEYPQHFTRVFKKHFGLTPSEFLRK